MHAMTRCGAEDTIHELLRRAVCVPTWRYLWVKADGFTFIPALSDTIYGDGRALFHLTTIQSRPQFYVIRCCSSWPESNFSDSPNFGDFTDDIRERLEDEFGPARPDSEEDDPEVLADGNPWPALDDEDGIAWGQVDWPKLPGVEMEWIKNEHGWRCHTILARDYAAEDQFARWVDDGGGRSIAAGNQ